MRTTALMAPFLLLWTSASTLAQPSTRPASTQPASTPAAVVPGGEAPRPAVEPAAVALAPDVPETDPAPSIARSAALKLWEKTSISTLWYLGYANGESADERFNRVFVGRGYVTLKFKPVKWFQPRVTLDTHQDEEGDWKVRLKYLYAKFVVPIETALVTDPSVELGIVHGPWFDFEEHIDNYRMQGTMFMERNKLLNSADMGGTLAVLLGRPLPAAYQKTVSSKYPGSWGSIQLGIYNGGGYHAAEANKDKVFASRVSLRPAGPWLPNLQLSHFFLAGKGNTDQPPKWIINNLMASFEQRYFTLTAQVGLGEGNQKGDRVDESTGEPLDWFGYSLFGEVKLPFIWSSVIARVDRFDWDTDGGEPATTRLIAGYAFHFLPKNFVLLSVDRVTHDDQAIPSDWQAQVTLQVHYPPK